MNEISEEFEIDFYDGGNKDPENIPYLQSCIFDEKTTHSTSKGRNFTLILKLKDNRKYFALKKIEICTPRGNQSSLYRCVLLFTKDQPFQGLSKFDDCVDEERFKKTFKYIKSSDRRQYFSGYFTTLLDNVTEYRISRNRKAFSDRSSRPKGRYINIKLISPKQDDLAFISINSIKLFGEFLTQEEVMIDQMVSADEERREYFLENEEWFHTLRIPLRSQTIRICRLFMINSPFWSDLCSNENKNILDNLQFEELRVDEMIIRKMFCGLDDDHYNIKPRRLIDYFLFFQHLGLKDFMLSIVKKIEGLDQEALVSLLLKTGPVYPKSSITLALLNKLSNDRFEVIKQFRAELEQHNIVNLLCRHKIRNILFHPDFKNSFPVSTFQKSSARIVKALYSHQESRNLYLIPSSPTPKNFPKNRNEKNIMIEEEETEEEEQQQKVHFEVLCWKSNFFHRMLSFGGTERESLLSKNKIKLELLPIQPLKSYLYFLYHSQIKIIPSNSHYESEEEEEIIGESEDVSEVDENKKGQQYDILSKLYTHGEMFCENELIERILHWVRKNESFVRVGVREKFIRLYQKFLYDDVYSTLQPLERRVLTLSSGLFPQKKVILDEILWNNRVSSSYLNKYQKKEVESWLVETENLFQKRIIIGGDKTGYAQWNNRIRRLGWKIEFTVDENGRCTGTSQNEGQWSDDGHKEVNGTLDKEGNLQLICDFSGGSFHGQKNAYVGTIKNGEFRGTMVQLSVGRTNAGSIGAHGTIGGNVVVL